MTEEKIKNILKAMEGITYLEWKKLQDSIEKSFQSEVCSLKNKLQIATPEEIIEKYQRDYQLF